MLERIETRRDGTQAAIYRCDGAGCATEGEGSMGVGWKVSPANWIRIVWAGRELNLCPACCASPLTKVLGQ